LPLLLLTVAAAGCGHSSAKNDTPVPPATTTSATPAPTTPSTATTPGTQPKTAIRVYLVRDGRVSPVRRIVPSTPAIGQGALDELRAGPTADERSSGLSTAIGSLRLGGLSIKDGEADLGALAPGFPLSEAQVVY